MSNETQVQGFANADADVAGVKLTRGTEGLEKVRQAIERDPEKWCRHFDGGIEKALFANVTGALIAERIVRQDSQVGVPFTV